MEHRLRAGGCAAVMVLLVLSCGGGKFDEAEWIVRGQQAVAPFKQSLKQALVDGLSEGPEAAIDVCRIAAPRIADEASPDGVLMGRTSHRLRNPDNAPRPWVTPLLQHYLDNPRDSLPMAVNFNDGRVGYVEPIIVQPMCLTCHGQSIPDGVAARLEEAYPGDQATGFSEGDVRGVFWVEFYGAGVAASPGRESVPWPVLILSAVAVLLLMIFGARRLLKA